MLSGWDLDGLALKRRDVVAPGLFVAPAGHVAVHEAARGHITDSINVDAKSRLAWYVWLICRGANDLCAGLRSDSAGTIVDEHSRVSREARSSEGDCLATEDRAVSGHDTSDFGKLWSDCSVIGDVCQVSGASVDGQLGCAAGRSVRVVEHLDTDQLDLTKAARAGHSALKADRAEDLRRGARVKRVPALVDELIVQVDVRERCAIVVRALNLKVTAGVWGLVEQVVEEDLDLVDRVGEASSCRDLRVASRGGVVLRVSRVHAVVERAQIETSSCPGDLELLGQGDVVLVCRVGGGEGRKHAGRLASRRLREVELALVTADFDRIVFIALNRASDTIALNGIHASTSE